MTKRNLGRLKGSQRVRQRVNVMFGSSGHKGVCHSLYEIFSNSIDRFKKGYGNKIIITQDENNILTVEDFADGLPMDWNEKEKAYNWDLALKVLYGGDNYETTNSNDGVLGTNGLGLTSTQYASEFMKVTVYTKDNIYKANFKKGRPVDKDTFEFIKEDSDDLFTKEEGSRVLSIEPNKTDRTGTIITYKPDSEVFSTIELDTDWIKEKLQRQAVVNTGLTIEFNDNKNHQTHKYFYENFEEYLKQVVGDSINYNLGKFINLSGTGTGKDTPTSKEYTISYNLCLCINNKLKSQSYFHNSSELTELNNNATTEGLERALVNGFNKFIKENNLYKPNEGEIKFLDIEPCLVSILSSKSNYTSYSNQTKLSIDNIFIKKFLIKDISSKLLIFLNENLEESKNISKQILINKRAREKAESTRADYKKKFETNINVLNKVKGLIDCKSKDRNLTELYITEGQSALGSIADGRDSKFQACFPIRGKILNCLKATLKQIGGSEMVINLIRAIGCGVEIKVNNKDFIPFEKDKIRYGKIILASDGDVDGYQIRTLLLTLLYVLCPTLIKEGYVYIVEAPLFEVKIGKKTYYLYTEDEKNEFVKKHSDKNLKISRNKGLGEMTEEAIAETMMNPETRRLIQVTMDDIEKANKYFELFLGETVEDRKEYIIKHFEEFEKEQYTPYKEKEVIHDVLKKNYMPYAVDVIKDRAIIGIDGFKPVHRRILYSMKCDKLLFGERVKSAKAVGNVLKYHPHGDSSVYDTMVRFAQVDSMLLPFIDGKGNFGKHTSTSVREAHMRYTEMKLSPVVKELFDDLDKINELMVDNFDGSAKEPKTLPVKFPTILANPSKGIAVGMASNFPSFNLKEICQTVKAFIDNEDIEILDYLKAPDFPTGGQILLDKKEMKSIYDTGRGSFKVRSKYEIIEKENIIKITEIPYTTTREKIIEEVTDQIKEKVITEIIDIQDLTDRKGMNIEISYRKNCNVNLLLNKLFKYTSIEDSFACNFNIIINDRPKILNMKEILREWINFRKYCLSIALNKKIKNKENEIELLEGLKLISTNIDKTIEIIRFAETDELMIEQLMSYFNLNKNQALYISSDSLGLRNINLRVINKKLEPYEKLKAELVGMQNQCNNEGLEQIIKNDLDKIEKAYSSKRKSAIIEKGISFSKEDLIEDYETKITITEKGYLKKIRATGFRSNLINATKDNDKIVKTISSANKDTIVIFTNKGKAYKLKGYEIDDVKMSSLGLFIGKLFRLEKDEKCIGVISLSTFKEDVIVAFDNGRIARISAIAFDKRRKELSNGISIEENLVDIFTLNEEENLIVCKSSLGKILAIDKNDMRAKKSRDTIGVMGQKLKGNSKLVVCKPERDIEGIANYKYYLGKPNTTGKLLRKKIDEFSIR
ncbi:DNA topoisomerase [Clostridium perfringens]|nr:DNA topoisomerase [Clostridium perfringens]MDK0982925.1 DNA gyrase subunit A [Clostridium perfringens]